MASSPDILWQGIQMKMWNNTFPKIGESLSAKLLSCLELHVDQLRALWKITWMYMTVAQFTTCLLIKDQKKNYFNMYQYRQHRLERKPEYLLKMVTGDVMTEQPNCHHSWSKTVRHTCWVSNNALHKMLQTAALSLDCLYKLSSRLHWREQHSWNVVVVIHSVQKPSDHCAHVSALQDDHRNVFCIYRLRSGNISCITNNTCWEGGFQIIKKIQICIFKLFKNLKQYKCDALPVLSTMYNNMYHVWYST